MLLTLTTTHRPATDLGYLLAKHPAHCHERAFGHGRAWLFFPEATEARCTACLLLDIDPIALSRSAARPGAGAGGASSAPLEPYVNDRPYVASSFLSVAIARTLGSALKGRSRERPELAETAIPLEAHLPALPAAGGESFLRDLFEPLGYELEVEPVPLDEAFPCWGPSRLVSLRLHARLRLAELLNHLYVLLPVLDDRKHYWVGEAELDKLLHAGGDWLATHPEREIIARRYLKRDRRMVGEALRQLLAGDDPDSDAEEDPRLAASLARARNGPLAQRRRAAIISTLVDHGSTSVLDIGCGDGRLLQDLLADSRFARIAGTDVSPEVLRVAAKMLHLDECSERQRQRLALFQSSALYRDARYRGFDALVVSEVIEHVDPSLLKTLARMLFGEAQPPLLILTTPNRDYNALYPRLPAGDRRERDHRFEWSRAEFQDWCLPVAAQYGYQVRFEPIGDPHPELGASSQMAIFTRADSRERAPA
ncbi:3' terminal RNA ribose 2'-O-methyltransferase Hen1 [Thiorhodovibrio frisius]|uniref:Small RNA 2'-O-methyltransferase n=1 Tax=Thiorhodovibrio frisius TaxID=631362 RepID=H8YVD5_9GAMM|nr:3' terminal RNA ribose 2'-O-methyltransferase Hen1 [Thiorhodovibrio frisius]EIC23875.1 3'' terminal RNA ribose 2''-O-methyltransferase Hen1 [Thiorhodovibrio frisius]WPL23118.1 bifunctional 3-demethylubiquinone-9 3-methyltransferase/ 2-octaprenyl-6-hydroxy phenol methylase [Thiorhodovibrio frisius]